VLSVAASPYAAHVESLAFHESGGFRLDNLAARLVADSVHAEVEDLDLRTPNSRFRLSMEARYPSLANIAEQLDQLEFAVTTSESFVRSEERRVGKDTE